MWVNIIMDLSENNEKFIELQPYRHHIKNFLPITDQMLNDIPNMNKESIQHLLTVYSNVIQQLLKIIDEL